MDAHNDCYVRTRCTTNEHCEQREVLGILKRNGCLAEFISLPVANLHVVPDSLSNRCAVFAEPTAAAFRILEQLEEMNFSVKNKKVLVIGDGKLAMLVCQVMKLAEPGNLTVCCKHAARKSLIENELNIEAKMQSDMVGDNQQKWNVVIDATGSPSGLTQALSLVQSRGIVFLKSTCAPPVNPLDPSTKNTSLSIDQANEVVVREICIRGSRCGPFKRAVDALAQGTIKAEFMIAKEFPLSQGPEALAAARGNLKIIVKCS